MGTIITSAGEYSSETRQRSEFILSLANQQKHNSCMTASNTCTYGFEGFGLGSVGVQSPSISINPIQTNDRMSLSAFP